MNSNSNSSAGGGGGRILSSIGINLSPRTREVAAGTVAGDQIRCQRAVQFYEFLKTKGSAFTNVPFVDVPTITVEREGVFKVVSRIFMLPFSQSYGNTTISPDKSISLSNTFCFNQNTQMLTSYLDNNNTPGYLTMIGFTKDDADNDIIWYVLTFCFDEHPDRYCIVTIDGFCKNNDLNINGSRVGVDVFLRLCEEFNKTDNFKITYCRLEPLPGVIDWWKLFGFYGVGWVNRRFTMIRDFPDTPYTPYTPAPISLSSVPVTQQQNQKDKLEDELFERLQTIVPEDFTGKKRGDMKWGDSDSEDLEADPSSQSEDPPSSRKKVKPYNGGSKRPYKKKKSNKRKTNKKNKRRQTRRKNKN
jgi:hypothetical protein